MSPFFSRAIARLAARSPIRSFRTDPSNTATTIEVTSKGEMQPCEPHASPDAKTSTHLSPTLLELQSKGQECFLARNRLLRRRLRRCLLRTSLYRRLLSDRLHRSLLRNSFDNLLRRSLACSFDRSLLCRCLHSHALGSNLHGSLGNRLPLRRCTILRDRSSSLHRHHSLLRDSLRRSSGRHSLRGSPSPILAQHRSTR